MEIYKIFVNNEIEFLIQDGAINGANFEDLTETDKEEICDNFINDDEIWENINTFLIDEIKRIIKRKKK